MSSNNSRLNQLAVKTVQGTVWTYAAYYSGRAIVFVTTIILARLLSQDDFGVVGYALVTISFLEVLNDLGIGPALIYHEDNEATAHTAFWLSIMVSIVLLGLSWLGAPLVGAYFQDLRAVPVLRVMALSFPLAAFGTVHDNLLSKQLSFKEKFWPSFARALGKGVVSVGLALAGFGAWSLVYGQLAGVALTSIVFWRVLPWRPALVFSRDLAVSLLRYGTSIVALNALAITLLNLDYLFVGRWMGAAALGVYTLAFRVPDLLITQFGQVVSKVIFPVYVKMRDGGKSLSEGFLTTMQYVSMVTLPLGIGIALVAEPFVLGVLTEKWIEAIPVMRAIAIYAMLFSLSYNAGSLYKAMGKPEVLTWLALLRLVLLAPALYWATTQIGTIAGVGWTHAAIAFVSGTINLVVAARFAQVSMANIAATVRPSVISTAGMALTVIGTLALMDDLPPLLSLGAAVTVGGVTYLALLLLQQPDLIQQARQVVTASVGRR